jgi:ADP-heptose:LPS heptosyltransferase
LNRTGRPRADVGKVLLIRLRRIGDVVMTTPAVALLKEHFPGASLTYLVEEPFRRLVEGNPALDRVIAVQAKQGFGEFAGLVRELRKERFDVVIDFHGGPRASWITFASGARLKIGYAIRTKGFLYDVRVPRAGDDGAPIHSVRNHVNLVRALGAEIADGGGGPGFRPGVRFHRTRPWCLATGEYEDIPPLALPAAKPEEAERVAGIVREGWAMASGAGKGAAKLVVLHIGAGNKFRDWGTENIAELVKLLAGVPGVKVALIGAEGDCTTEDEVRRAAPNAVIPLAGRLNLIEIRELIVRAALYVGPDSGPMHIAASTATPIVAYFGPTLPAVFAPWRPGGGKTVILEKALDCRPCRQHECITDDYRCLRTLSPADVFAACNSLL